MPEFLRDRAAALWLVGIGSIGVALGLSIDQPVTLNVAVLLVGVALTGMLNSVVTPSHLRPAMFARAAVVLLLYFAVGVTQLQMSPQSDSLGYYETASALSGHGGETGEVFLVSGKEGYVRLLTVVFWFGTPSMATPVAVNAGLIALCVIVVGRTAWMLFSDVAALRVPILFLTLPPVLIWGSQGLREAGVFLGLAWLGLATAQLRERFGPTAAVSLLASVTFLFMFRGGIAVVVLAATSVGLLLSRGGRGSWVGPLASLGVGAAGMLWAMQRFPYLRDIRESYFDAERQTAVRSSLGQAGSGFEQDISTPLGMLTGLVRVLAGPYPWEWPRFPVAVPDVLAWWVALALIAMAIRRVEDRRRLLILMVPAAGIALAIALGVTNYGMLLRVRSMMLICLLPLIAYSLGRSPKPSGDESRRYRSVVAARGAAL